MENQSEVSGYVASTLVLLTFVAKDMRLLRTIAHLRHDRVAAGRAFSAHGVAIEHRSTCRDRQGSLSHGRQNPSQGAVRAQTLCTGMTARDQSPVAPWPIFLRTAEDSAPSLTNPTNQVIGRSVRALSSPAGYQGGWEGGAPVFEITGGSPDQSCSHVEGSGMKAMFRVLVLKHLCRWAMLGVVVGLANLHAEPQFPAGGHTETSEPRSKLPRDLDPLRGSNWGPGGPWGDQVPYTPRPKPSGWVDPEPSRWLWTGECDPYACPYRSQDDISAPGQDPQNLSGAVPAYRGSPPP